MNTKRGFVLIIKYTIVSVIVGILGGIGITAFLLITSAAAPPPPFPSFNSTWGFGVKDGTNVFQICTKYDAACYQGIAGSSNGKLDHPRGIAVDSKNYIYVADTNNHRIQRFNSDGKFITKWGKFGDANGEFSNPSGIAVDSKDYIYVAGGYRIQRFTASGTFLTKWGSGGFFEGEFNNPLGIAVDSKDYIYVADANNHRIQKFNPNGDFIAMWGFGVKAGEPPAFQICYNNCKAGISGSSDGQFNYPWRIAVDSKDYIYVADTSNQRIQRFTSSGTFLTKWGVVGTSKGEFNNPSGIAVDSADSIYVADTNNNRLQKFSYGPTPLPSKRVFATSTTFQGHLGGLAGADAECQARAVAAGLGGIWRAWLSSSSTDAKDRIPDATYKRLDSAVIATNKVGLTDGSTDYPIDRDENNSQIIGEPSVWTGTTTQGVKKSNTCSDWMSAGGQGDIGSLQDTNGLWTEAGSVTCGFIYRHLYCFEQ